MRRVDLVASQPHYVPRLEAVWQHLTEDERGLVHISDALRVGSHLVESDISGNVLLAASYGDARSALSNKRVVLMEHGIGQRYEWDHPAYAGGQGRSFVDLFLCPNDRVAQLNLASNPDTPAVVVGDPYLDMLQECCEQSDVKPFDVAVSFHADLSDDVAPEAGSTWRFWEPAIRALCSSGFRVFGHSHPRDRVFARSWYASMGVIYTEHFADVVRFASSYVCDNSSTIYYAAAMGLPVVLLNSPQYRRDVEQGLRFWEFADVGRQADSHADLIPSIDEAVRHPRKHHRRVEQICDELFPWRDGQAGWRGAEAIRSTFG